MALPTFLGIGVPRSGTTWLHKMLQTHPEVYVPKYRKEVHFFDENYEKGVDWYKKFFPSDVQAHKYQAIGEITPFYLYYDVCIERILKMPSITKLIVILRNPMDRAYSQYICHIRDGVYFGSFESCMTHHPKMIEESFYCERLKRYLEYFEREQMLILIHEQTVASSLSETKDIIARFLDIDVESFPSTAGLKKVNARVIPKAHSAYLFCAKVADCLKDRDLDCIVSWAHKFGIKRLFGKRDSLPQMTEETRQYLRDLYKPDISELESLLGTNLDFWK